MSQDSVSTVVSPPTNPHDEGVGQVLGRYKLLEKLGEGGFGAVWLAEQKEPVRRKIALKIIKLGMDTKAVVARFDAERQALAMMDHPNIAKVLDGGATELGRPYFVMELVRGTKITEYCDQNNLPTTERLDLFIKVCQAIQHAHQKGIIHRDIKPSNILVTLHDGVPVPKVIDFGIAKATHGELTDRTIHTQFQQFIGTPAYMSPEQAEMSGLDIDTRSDIYSLGVLLYELLTGRTPFDAKELVSMGVDAMRKTIREKEPLRPSTRVVTLQGEERTSTARHHACDMPRLIHQLKGDLDWIAMKCLEKDRTRRYETANGLAADLKRFLHHEPVVARPPSAAYRFQKAVRRNKFVFCAGAAVALALLIGILASLWQATRATRARIAADRATEQARRSEQIAREAEAGQMRLRQQAEVQALAERRRSYASDMTVAQQAIALNNYGRAQQLLDRHRPNQSQVDVRGWEWRYLWQFCQSDSTFTLCRQTNTIWSLSPSRDGRWLAIGEHEHGGFSIWDLRTRKQLVRPDANSWLVATAFSPDGSLVAFSTEPVRGVGENFSLRLWDVAAGRVVRTIKPASPCHRLCFSEDGTRLISFSSRPAGKIQIWRVSDGQNLASWPAPTHFQTIGDVSADFRLAAHLTGNQLRVLNLATGEELWSKTAGEDAALTAAFSPDGRTLASTAGYAESIVRLWDVPSGQEVSRIEGHRAWCGTPVFWPDGKTLATASADQTIRLWDISDRSKPRALAVLRGHNCEIWALALLPDNVTLVSGGKDGTVRFWDTGRFQQKQPFVVVPEPVRAWCFAPDSNSLLALHPEGKVVRWKGESFREPEQVIQVTPSRGDACWSAGAGRLAQFTSNGEIAVWDLEGRALLRTLKLSQPTLYPVGFRGQNQLLVYGEDGLMHLFDLRSGNEIQSWRGAEASRAGDVSPDQRWGATFGTGGASLLRDYVNAKSLPFSPSLRQASGAAFSPDGKFLAAVSWLGIGKIWSTDDWRELGTIQGFLLGIDSVAFSPDSSRIAAGSAGKEAIKLWDSASSQELLTLEAEGSTYYPTAFSPDGNLLGSRNAKGILHLWRAPSWQQIAAAENSANSIQQ